MDLTGGVAANLRDELFGGEAAVSGYVAAACAVCAAACALLLRLDAGSAPVLALSRGAVTALPEASRLWDLHHRPDGALQDAVTASLASEAAGWAGAAYCGVLLRDPQGAPRGVLAVLRPTASDGSAASFGAAEVRLMQALASQLDADEAKPSVCLQDLLASNMTELAWMCEPAGGLLWANRAFLDRLDPGPSRARFLARWQREPMQPPQERRGAGPAGLSGLLPAMLSDGGCGWFETSGVAAFAGGPRLGLARDVTVRLRAEMDRPQNPAEPRPAVAFGLARTLNEIVERIRASRLAPPPRVQSAGCEWMNVRCDPHRLEAAILDLAVSREAAAPLTLVLSGAASDHAQLTASNPRATSPEDLPMLQALLRSCSGRAESDEMGLRILLPLYWRADEPRRPAAARILVVDDEAVVRMLVVDLLRERGHSVLEAEDAFIAMSRLQGDAELDLMITDIGLPGGFDGATLARRARQIRPDLPILFITGYAFGAGTANDVKLEPGIPVLTKPFTLSILSARIADLLSGRKAPGSRAPSLAAPGRD